MEIVIFIGLQATGKSSFHHARFAATHAHVSKDNFRNNSNPARRQQTLIAEALDEGQSVVVDNTNASVSDRTLLIAQGRDKGARIVGYYFASSLSACLLRNRERDGRACVPDIALYTTAQRLERPTYGEGFDELFHVRLGDERLGDGADYIVSAWEEDKPGASESNTDEMDTDEKNP